MRLIGLLGLALSPDLNSGPIKYRRRRKGKRRWVRVSDKPLAYIYTRMEVSK